jgi:uncharacterized protein (TIGR02271 family)
MAAKKQLGKRAKKAVKKSAVTSAETNDAAEAFVIPVAEEHLEVDKRQVVTGRINLVKSVEERLETITVPLQRQTFEVKRVPMDEVMREPTASRQEGDTLIIPVFEEILVVEKRYRLKEEIHVVAQQTVHDEVQDISLRQEVVRLERNGQEVVIEEKAP